MDEVEMGEAEAEVEVERGSRRRRSLRGRSRSSFEDHNRMMKDLPARIDHRSRRSSSLRRQVSTYRRSFRMTLFVLRLIMHFRRHPSTYPLLHLVTGHHHQLATGHLHPLVASRVLHRITTLFRRPDTHRTISHGTVHDLHLTVWADSRRRRHHLVTITTMDRCKGVPRLSFQTFITTRDHPRKLFARIEDAVEEDVVDQTVSGVRREIEVVEGLRSYNGQVRHEKRQVSDHQFARMFQSRQRLCFSSDRSKQANDNDFESMLFFRCIACYLLQIQQSYARFSTARASQLSTG